MVKLPLATFEKVLKESKKNIRVSDRATKTFVGVIEEIAKDIASEAGEMAEHANRRTIMESDVKIAAKRYLRYV
jgi:histone H3/H4